MNKDKNSVVSPQSIPPVVDATSQQQDINNLTPEIQQHYLPQYVQPSQQYLQSVQQPVYVPQYVQPPATQYYSDYTQQQQQVYVPQYVQPSATQYYSDYTQQYVQPIPQYYYYYYVHPQPYYTYNNYVADKTSLAQDLYM